MTKSLLLPIIMCIALTSQSQVQIIRSGEKTISTKGLYAKTDLNADVLIPAIDVSKVRAEQNRQGRNKFAEPVPTDINPLGLGRWENQEVFSVMRLKITAVKAFSISVTFDKLTLSPNAELYLYNTDRTVITGLVTSKENISKDGLWSSNVFQGNAIILELKVPTNEIKENQMHIRQILYGLTPDRDLTRKDSLTGPGFGQSGNCNVNAICDPTWDVERRAIAQVVDQQGNLFSAALIMNTCAINRAFLLTADHCVVDGNGNVVNQDGSTFEFLWFSPTCTPTTNTSNTLLFNGATIKSRWAQTDFALLQLKQSVPANSNLTFWGWSRSNTPPNSSVAIHHPEGDIMKIAHDFDPAVVGNVGTFTNTAWRVVLDAGSVEEGSSGSPLIDAATHRVVGQLFSSTQSWNSPCNTGQGGTNSGRFDLPWNGGGTQATRLLDFLDPSASGAMTTNTTNVANLFRFPAEHNYVIAGTDQPCVNSNSQYQISLNTLPAGATVTWTVVSPTGTLGLTSTTGTSTEVIPINPTLNEQCYLQADISFSGCSYTIYKSLTFRSAYWQGSITGYYGWFNPVYGNNLVEGDNYLYTAYGSGGAQYFEIWNEGANAHPNTSYWEYVSGTPASYGYLSKYIGFDLVQLGGVGSVDSYYNFNFTDNCGSHSIPYHFMSIYGNPPSYRVQQQSKEKYQVKISPNPALSFVNISVVDTEPNQKSAGKKFDYNKRKIIRVYNKLGTMLIQRSEIIPASGIRLNISALKSSDIYNVVIESENGLWLSAKFIKQ